MTLPGDGDFGIGDPGALARVEGRGQQASVSLRRAADLEAPELGRLVHVSRTRWLVRSVVSLATIAICGAAVLAVASAVHAVSLAWLTGGVLAVLLILTWVLCAHAGGHAWLVPIPALALAVGWALVAASGSWSSGSAWWLAVASAACSAASVLVAATALRQRVTGSRATHLPARGADGVAITPLTPTGVVRVGAETWTAESVSGPLAAGTPVHVVSVNGLRLLVWSEMGTVPGADVLETEEGTP